MDKFFARLVDGVQATFVTASAYLIYLSNEQSELLAVALICVSAGLALAFESKRRAQVFEGTGYVLFVGMWHMWQYTGGNGYWLAQVAVGVFLVFINIATIAVPLGKAVGKDY